MRGQTAQRREEKRVPERNAKEPTERKPAERKRPNWLPTSKEEHAGQEQETQEAFDEGHRHRRELLADPLKQQGPNRPRSGRSECSQDAYKVWRQNKEQIGRVRLLNDEKASEKRLGFP